MKPAARGAQQHAYTLIGALLGRAYGPDEADLWRYLVHNDPTFAPEQAVVAECDGGLRACTVVVPRGGADPGGGGAGGRGHTGGLRSCPPAAGARRRHRAGGPGAVDKALAEAAAPADGAGGELRELREADLLAVCGLYEGAVAATLRSVRRTPDP